MPRVGSLKATASKIEHIGSDGRVWLDCGDSLKQLNLSAARHYNIYREEKLPLAIGDKIRLTQNVTVDGKRLFNGSVHEVVGVGGLSGKEVCIASPRSHSKLPLPEGSFTHGYVSTSHSAQGKTTDRIILSQSSLSAAAASMEQFYVSVSRGRTDIKIFTDSKAELADNAKSSSDRKLAVELEAEAKRKRVMRRSQEDERRRSQARTRHFVRGR